MRKSIDAAVGFSYSTFSLNADVVFGGVPVAAGTVSYPAINLSRPSQSTGQSARVCGDQRDEKSVEVKEFVACCFIMSWDKWILSNTISKHDTCISFEVLSGAISKDDTVHILSLSNTVTCVMPKYAEHNRVRLFFLLNVNESPLTRDKLELQLTQLVMIVIHRKYVINIKTVHFWDC